MEGSLDALERRVRPDLPETASRQRDQCQMKYFARPDPSPCPSASLVQTGVNAASWLGCGLGTASAKELLWT